LDTVGRIEEEMQLFASTFLGADGKELRKQSVDTVREYEEAISAWEQLRDEGELCNSDTKSERGRWSGEELLQILDRTTHRPERLGLGGKSRWKPTGLRKSCGRPSMCHASQQRSGDWDMSCYLECRKLQEQEAVKFSGGKKPQSLLSKKDAERTEGRKRTFFE
jgi:hypothetical protein